MLDATTRVDLAVVDHGYAGAAINAGVPVVTPMDTNDPAVAVAKRMGADVCIIPMDDNRPLSCYLPIVDLMVQFAETSAWIDGQGGPVPPSRPAPPDLVQTSAKPSEPAIAPGEPDQLRIAERLVAERAGPVAPLDELVFSLLDGYHDQFLQAHFASDEVVRVEPHPALDLVIYKRLHDALRSATVQRLRLTESSLTPEEIVAYLEGPTGSSRP
jgi:hypothetical protein